MTPERWQQIETVFSAAVEMPLAQRAAYLQAQCGADEALRREVESLLSYEQDAQEFIERPVWAEAAQRIHEQAKPAGSVTQTLAERQIEQYRIIELIGQGGMGKVFRARDNKLGREVALKVLSPTFARDPARVERFEREAKILAVLNHPNIATIHAFEQSRDLRYLVLEFVQGPTLAERLQTGALPLAEAIPLFRQLAAALSAAHAQRIIHRDFKPANIKLAPHGLVKVLDFGLAKVAYERSSISAVHGEPLEPHQMPTRALADTQSGMILGTVPYMSPEQTRGATLDRTADWWAFGCVLFEALTGRQLFAGANYAEIVARIQGTEPDWQALPADTPAAVRELLKRCLSKTPTERLRNAAEAEQLLKQAELAMLTADAKATEDPAVPAPPPPMVPPRPTYSQRDFIFVLVMSVVLLTGAYLLWSTLNR